MTVKRMLFVVVDHQKDPNVYVIQSLDKKGPKRTGLRWIQLHEIPVSRDLNLIPN